MWLVTSIGFFNIVCQDDDKEHDLLTVKARCRQDLIDLEDYVPFELDIEESNVTDYRFRRKANRHLVADGIQLLLREIDYPKTKPKLMENRPDRAAIYLAAWSDLYSIQGIDETT